MIGIDTYSWEKIIRLKKDKKWTDLIFEILSKGDFFITHEGRKEFEHFYKDEKDLLDYIQIFPVIKSEIFHYYLNEGFDVNDSSLLEYAEKSDYIIITEDIPMLSMGNLSKKRTIQLLDYFYLLKRDDYLSRREFYHLVKLFKKWKNITVKKEKIYLKIKSSFYSNKT